MTYPLWILNSTLFLLLCGAAGVVLVFKEGMPRRFRIEVHGDTVRTPKKKLVIDESTILENDIFGTGYVKRAATPPQEVGPAPMPAPPPPVVIPQRKDPEIKFLRPLAVTLKGIMYMNDDSLNAAILADKASKEEKNYHVGDSIDDAQILRIFRNKVLFVRSNSQQEVLYLTEEEAREDQAIVMTEWDSVVKKVSDTSYQVQPQEFLKRVTNLARFIDLLDLTTVFSAGKSIGCRAENNGPDSLAAKLGLQVGDIIQSIDGVPAVDTQHRLEIYKAVTHKTLGDTITVDVLRHGGKVPLTYTLHAFEEDHDAHPSKKHEAHQEPIVVEMPTPQELARRQRHVAEQQQRLAPTVQELKIREKRDMLEQGRRRGQNSLARYVE